MARPFARRIWEGQTACVQVWAQTTDAFEYVTVEFMTGSDKATTRRVSQALVDRLNAAMAWHLRGESFATS